MSKYVNRVIAKLLKDKGYNLPCEFYWFEGSTVSIPTRTQYRVENDWNSYTTNLRISAPLILDVVDWLLDKHEIWIDVTIGKDCNHVWFDYNIYSAIKPRKDDELGEEFIEYEDDPNEKWLNYETTYDSMIDEKFEIMEKLNYPTPKEAYLAAIEYTLKHLI